MISRLFLTANMLIALASAAFVPAAADGRDPYKDLPGVKVPKQIDKQKRASCTSYIARPWPTTIEDGGLGYRVYECGDGGVTSRSTRPPDEVDYQKRQEYYKPWTSDGF